MYSKDLTRASSRPSRLSRPMQGMGRADLPPALVPHPELGCGDWAWTRLTAGGYSETRRMVLVK